MTYHLLIAKVSNKAIGVGIKMGYAVAAYKPVIYLRKAYAAHSTIAAGSIRQMVTYQSIPDLRDRLMLFYQIW